MTEPLDKEIRPNPRWKSTVWEGIRNGLIISAIIIYILAR